MEVRYHTGAGLIKAQELARLDTYKKVTQKSAGGRDEKEEEKAVWKKLAYTMWRVR